MRNISFKYTIIVPLVIQIIALSGIIGFLSYRNGKETIDQISTQYLLEISSRIKQNLKNLYISSYFNQST